MRLSFDLKDEIDIAGFQMKRNSNLYSLLSSFGPTMSEALLNFYAKKDDKALYKSAIKKESKPYFKSYFTYFNSLDNPLKRLVENAYQELQTTDEEQLERLYDLFDVTEPDKQALKVWGQDFTKISGIRNKILKEETDFSSRLPRLAYSYSVNANYSYIFPYNFKKSIDPRKVKKIIENNTIKQGHDPESYTSLNLFSLNNKQHVAIAFYGRAIEITDFNDLMNSMD